MTIMNFESWKHFFTFTFTLTEDRGAGLASFWNFRHQSYTARWPRRRWHTGHSRKPGRHKLAPADNYPAASAVRAGRRQMTRHNSTSGPRRWLELRIS
ncbi:hypothetical protein ACTXI4_12215 [Glutamicibacter ardleyensis]|uniref:hypothetical protein n=1 Tax=Glutamicibacter ardleyensis TaxID=225894 RepID=UPI003FD447ED